MIFSHSSKDMYLVLLSALNLVVILWAIIQFQELSVITLIMLSLLIIFLNCTNYQCIAHNFIHNPFFRSPTLNFIFSVFNTLPLGVPQSLYRVHHLLHHRYNNGPPTPGNGNDCGDPSSIYQYASISGCPEHIASYAFRGPLRVNIRTLYRKLSKLFKKRYWAEIAALCGFWLGLAAYDIKAFPIFYLPVWYLGQVSAYAENYLEHYGANPLNKLKDSVSCYGALYNLIWFNNGYHQEHHLRPAVHWSRIKEVKAEMLPAAERRVVPVAHWLNFARSSDRTLNEDRR
jgi:fatty acid desaturase